LCRSTTCCSRSGAIISDWTGKHSLKPWRVEKRVHSRPSRRAHPHMLHPATSVKPGSRLSLSSRLTPLDTRTRGESVAPTVITPPSRASHAHTRRQRGKVIRVQLPTIKRRRADNPISHTTPYPIYHEHVVGDRRGYAISPLVWVQHIPSEEKGGRVILSRTLTM
jgi:hypothetical protein